MTKKAGLIPVLLLLLLSGCNLPGSSPDPPEDPGSGQSTTLSPTSTAAETAAIDSTPAATSEPTEAPTPTTAPSPTPFVCQEHRSSVVMLIEGRYAATLEDHLRQYERDLCRDQYRLIIKENVYRAPEDIRAYLADLYFNQPELNLAGAILVGDIPYAYQQNTVEYTNPDTPTAVREFVSMQYYADLDGEFVLSEEYQPRNGTAPLGEPIFDIHRGQIDWEIWVSVLPTYLGDAGETTAALRRYFEKNHAYRTGEINLPKTYLMIHAFDAPSEEQYNQVMRVCCQGTDNWTALDREGELRQIYMDNPVNDMSEEAGYQALSEGKADFTLIFDHGNVSSLGRINPPWLEEHDLNTVFLISHSCSVGDLTNPYAILNQILYHPRSQVLFSTGNTTEGGGLCTNEKGTPSSNISSGLMAGQSIGEAILNHINTPLIEPWSNNPESCFAPKIFYGDPTLTLRQ